MITDDICFTYEYSVMFYDSLESFTIDGALRTIWAHENLFQYLLSLYQLKKKYHNLIFSMIFIFIYFNM